METITKSSYRRVPFRQHNLQTATIPSCNQVYIKDGKVTWDIVSDTLSIEEAKRLTLKMVDLEYALP